MICKTCKPKLKTHIQNRIDELEVWKKIVKKRISSVVDEDEKWILYKELCKINGKIKELKKLLEEIDKDEVK